MSRDAAAWTLKGLPVTLTVHLEVVALSMDIAGPRMITALLKMDVSLVVAMVSQLPLSLFLHSPLPRQHPHQYCQATPGQMDAAAGTSKGLPVTLTVHLEVVALSMDIVVQVKIIACKLRDAKAAARNPLVLLPRMTWVPPLLPMTIAGLLTVQKLLQLLMNTAGQPLNRPRRRAMTDVVEQTLETQAVIQTHMDLVAPSTVTVDQLKIIVHQHRDAKAAVGNSLVLLPPMTQVLPLLRMNIAGLLMVQKLLQLLMNTAGQSLNLPRRHAMTDVVEQTLGAQAVIQTHMDLVAPSTATVDRLKIIVHQLRDVKAVATSPLVLLPQTTLVLPLLRMNTAHQPLNLPRCHAMTDVVEQTLGAQAVIQTHMELVAPSMAIGCQSGCDESLSPTTTDEFGAASTTDDYSWPTDELGAYSTTSSTGSDITLAATSTESSDGTPTNEPAVGGYLYQGCFNELSGGEEQHSLTGKAYIIRDDMTLELCADYCYGSAAYEWFGVAGADRLKGDECYCGHAPSLGVNLIDDDTACLTPCAGDSSEFCGGAGTLDMYRRSGDSGVLTTTDDSPSPATGTPSPPRDDSRCGKDFDFATCDPDGMDIVAQTVIIARQTMDVKAVATSPLALLPQTNRARLPQSQLQNQPRRLETTGVVEQTLGAQAVIQIHMELVAPTVVTSPLALLPQTNRACLPQSQLQNQPRRLETMADVARNLTTLRAIPNQHWGPVVPNMAIAGHTRTIAPDFKGARAVAGPLTVAGRLILRILHLETTGDADGNSEVPSVILKGSLEDAAPLKDIVAAKTQIARVINIARVDAGTIALPALVPSMSQVHPPLRQLHLQETMVDAVGNSTMPLVIRMVSSEGAAHSTDIAARSWKIVAAARIASPVVGMTVQLLLRLMSQVHQRLRPLHHHEMTADAGGSLMMPPVILTVSMEAAAHNMDTVAQKKKTVAAVRIVSPVVGMTVQLLLPLMSQVHRHLRPLRHHVMMADAAGNLTMPLAMQTVSMEGAAHSTDIVAQRKKTVAAPRIASLGAGTIARIRP
ncbi:MAG: hypothetical protein M1836_001556 [Candelina mexicana]|nr:MAG: hypothetical protein M1836_001556 [Candelina mexicana]